MHGGWEKEEKGSLNWMMGLDRQGVLRNGMLFGQIEKRGLSNRRGRCGR